MASTKQVWAHAIYRGLDGLDYVVHVRRRNARVVPRDATERDEDRERADAAAAKLRTARKIPDPTWFVRWEDCDDDCLLVGPWQRGRE